MVRPKGRYVRLDDAVTYFLAQWPSEGPTPATVRTYGAQLKWLSRWANEYGKTKLSDLTPELLRASMAAKMGRSRRKEPNFKDGMAAAHSVAMAARKMAEWLRAQGVPVADLTIVKPKQPPEHIQKRVSQEEFRALEQTILRRLVTGEVMPRVIIARDLALIYLLADTGMRAHEVVSMTVDSIDFDSGSISVRGKGRKERVLSILDAADLRGGLTLRLLEEWVVARASIRNASAHDELWLSVHGRPLSIKSLRDHVLAPLCREAGLPENRPPHAFRRAHFTEAYLADPRLIDVLSQRMGWSPSSRKMVDVYTRGAKVELARSTPIPSLGRRWTTDSPKVPVTNLRRLPIISNGVGPPRGETANDAAPSNPGRRNGNRAASQTSSRRPAPLA